MSKIFIFGHKKPDTDSVMASISLSYLKNQLGENTKAYVLGDLNEESKFALNYFNVKEPKYLNDVKLQIKDVNYHKNCVGDQHNSIYDSYNYMTKNEITGLPIVNNDKKFIGMVSIKDIAKELIKGDFDYLKTSYKNIIKTIEGQEILKFDDEISGNILVASYRSTSFIENVELNQNTILIVGDRHSIIEYAVNSGIKLIILTNSGYIKDEHLEIARKNKVNIIKTNFNTFHVSKTIALCNYINTIITNKDIICFDENDYLNDFIEISNKVKHTNYPIVDKQNKCLGLLRLSDISEKSKKKIILVDHNEPEQSVDGIDEAEILEVIDHHKIGNINTNTPINFRNMAVGSTNTIIYQLYQEKNIDIPKDIAGLMLSGILSDTLLLNSPTTTNKDRITVEKLSALLNIDYKKYGIEMLKAGTTLEGKTKEEILYNDFKVFNIENKKIGIGQIFTMNPNEILNEIDDYIKLIETITKNKNYYIIGLFITDILTNGSYIIYNNSSKSILENSFNIDVLKQGQYIKGCISRKKQIIPNIIDEIEK
ncbi:MAG: putative manganese-dependent inorganic diphosphatase [Firmicutes bacterium]|nr:putative manganese-dependent inorganic diphosphatase [Bacillota bacterium]